MLFILTVNGQRRTFSSFANIFQQTVFNLDSIYELSTPTHGPILRRTETLGNSIYIYIQTESYQLIQICNDILLLQDFVLSSHYDESIADENFILQSAQVITNWTIPTPRIRSNLVFGPETNEPFSYRYTVINQKPVDTFNTNWQQEGF